MYEKLLDIYGFEDVSLIHWDHARDIILTHSHSWDGALLHATRYTSHKPALLVDNKAAGRFIDLVLYLWDVKSRSGAKAVDDLVDVRIKKQSSLNCYQFHELSDQDFENVPDPDYIISGMMLANKVGLISGPGDVGKSSFAATIGFAMAQSKFDVYRPLWDGDLVIDPNYRGKPVVFVSYEDDVNGILRRIKGSILMHRETTTIISPQDNNPLRWIDVDGGDSYFRILSSIGADEHYPPMFEVTNGKADFTEFGKMLLDQISNMEPSPVMLFIDNAAAAFAADENSRGDVRQYMGPLNHWSQRTGCCTAVLCHPPKTPHKVSGNTDWVNSSRWHINFEPVPYIKKMAGVDSKDPVAIIRNTDFRLYRAIFDAIADASPACMADVGRFAIDALQDANRHFMILETGKLNEGPKRCPILVERISQGSHFYLSDFGKKLADYGNQDATIELPSTDIDIPKLKTGKD